MRPARTVAFVLLVCCLAVFGGWAAHAAVARAKRDAAAVLHLNRLPGLDRIAGPTPWVVGFAAANDSALVALARRQLPNWIENLKPLGAGKLADVAGLTLLGGGLLHADRRAALAGLTLLEANQAAGPVIDACKEAFGRVRPNRPQPGRWFAGGDSFPSSHATHAFLMACVMSAAFDDPEWSRALHLLAYGVALQRLHEGVHYPTDVLAGGALGCWIGHRLSVSHGLTPSSPPIAGLAASSRRGPGATRSR